MKSFVVCLLLLILIGGSLSFASDPVPEDVARFLDSRKLVSIIYFPHESSTLSVLAKQSIDSIVPRLNMLDMKKVLVRIEGFAPHEGVKEVSVPLSMNRALAVMNYMREKYHIDTGVFLIGCGDRELIDVPEDKCRRVEIALYDNLWDLEDAPIGELILDW